LSCCCGCRVSMLSAMWSPSRYVIVGKMDNLYYSNYLAAHPSQNGVVGVILCLGSRANFILSAISSIMPCQVCGCWMGLPGVPPWAFPVVPAWPPLAWAPNGCWLWSERCGGWICLCTRVCYRKWCRADLHHRVAGAGG
jgi:hypothetical protein